MDIRLRQLRPEHIPSERMKSSGVWDEDLTFEAGSGIMVHAPSGSGKTTLVHILYGLRGNYEGAVLLDDRPLADYDIPDKAALRQKGFSVVFQDLRLLPRSTGWENIRLNAELQPIHDEEKLRDMAAFLGMGDKLDRPCGTLSQGEKQRIAIVRALSQPFEWLLLDEPFSHLDEKNIARARDLILETLGEQEAGVLLMGLGFDYDFSSSSTLEL